MTTMEIANSPIMWIACGLAVAVVLAQALIFASQAWKNGEKFGLTKEQMKKAMKSSAITSIGPSVVILTGMLSLLISVGGPVAWMRLSMIGSVMFESLAAGIGTKTVGVSLGADELTNEALCMAVWTMVSCSVGWVIFATFAASRMDKIQNRISGGSTARLVAISGAASIALFAAMSGQHITKFNKNSIACLLGGVFMFLLVKISDREGMHWLKDWNLTISMLAAMIITALI